MVIQMKALEVYTGNNQSLDKHNVHVLYKLLQTYLNKQESSYPTEFNGKIGQTWPMYVLMQYPDLLASIWSQYAQDQGIHFYQDIAELGYVHAGLNESSTQALHSGIIWIKKIHEFTPREYQYGVTFHPQKCTESIGLITPEQWNSLHYIVFPNFTLESNDAAHIITGTCDIDQANLQDLTPQMTKNILLLERGLEHINPSEKNIQPDILQLFSTEIMQHYGFIPFQYDKQKSLLHCCMIDVDNTHVHALVQQTLKCLVQPYFMEQNEADLFWSKYKSLK